MLNPAVAEVCGWKTCPKDMISPLPHLQRSVLAEPKRLPSSVAHGRQRPTPPPTPSGPAFPIFPSAREEWKSSGQRNRGTPLQGFTGILTEKSGPDLVHKGLCCWWGRTVRHGFYRNSWVKTVGDARRGGGREDWGLGPRWLRERSCQKLRLQEGLAWEWVGPRKKLSVKLRYWQDLKIQDPKYKYGEHYWKREP